MALFSVHERDDRARVRAGEDWFAFLERVGPDRVFARIRDLVDSWFDELPPAQADALRTRLLSRNAAVSMPAFWELYLHAALLRCGLQMDYEPSLRASTRRPDYLVHGDQESFYLEARMVGDPEHRTQENKLELPLTEALREIDSSEFTLDFQIQKRGNTAPRMGPVKVEVTRWLDGLDRQQVRRLQKERGLRAVPSLVVNAGEWVFSFLPIPRPDARAGTPSPAGAISIFPGRTAWGGDWSRVGSALKEKARRYGELDRPFIIALLANDIFVDVENLASALHGEPAFSVDEHGRTTLGRAGGLWSDGAGARVSAVITARHVNPASVAVVEPLLWRAGHATHPLAADLPFTAEAQLADDGEVVVDERPQSMHAYFGLPVDWPGPERPFRD